MKGAFLKHLAASLSHLHKNSSHLSSKSSEMKGENIYFIKKMEKLFEIHFNM